MIPQRIRMLFLGDRSIADGVLTLYLDKYRSRQFQIIGVVSSGEFFECHKELLGSDVQYISNDARNTKEIERLIVDGSVNMLLSVQHNWILSADILALVDGLAFNLHNAKLPEYKGYNCISHAIYNGDKEYVSTIHWMSKDVDCGYIAYEEVTEISKSDSAKSLHKKTIESSIIASHRLFDSLKMRLDPPKIREIDNGIGTFYDRTSMTKLLRVTLQESEDEIDRKIRSAYYPPHNNAYVIVNGTRVELIPNIGA